MLECHSTAFHCIRTIHRRGTRWLTNKETEMERQEGECPSVIPSLGRFYQHITLGTWTMIRQVLYSATPSATRQCRSLWTSKFEASNPIEFKLEMFPILPFLIIYFHLQMIKSLENMDIAWCLPFPNVTFQLFIFFFLLPWIIGTSSHLSGSIIANSRNGLLAPEWYGALESGQMNSQLKEESQGSICLKQIDKVVNRFDCTVSLGSLSWWTTSLCPWAGKCQLNH